MIMQFSPPHGTNSLLRPNSTIGTLFYYPCRPRIRPLIWKSKLPTMQIILLYFMLHLPCIFLQSLYQPKNAHNVQFMTSIKLLHVSAPECSPQGVF